MFFGSTIEIIIFIDNEEKFHKINLLFINLVTQRFFLQHLTFYLQFAKIHTLSIDLLLRMFFEQNREVTAYIFEK